MYVNIYPNNELLKQNYLDRLNITRNSLNSIFMYPLIVEQKTKQPLECYGYLMSSRKEFRPVTTKIYLARSDINTAGFVKVLAQDSEEAFEYATSENLQIIGWWHNHGNNPCRHSPTDVGNMNSIRFKLGNSTLFYQLSPLEECISECVEHHHLSAEQKESANKTLQAQLTMQKNLLVREAHSFAYSFVVNNRQETYTEIALRKYCSICNSDIHYQPLPVEFGLTRARGDSQIDVAEMNIQVVQKINEEKLNAPRSE